MEAIQTEGDTLSRKKSDPVLIVAVAVVFLMLVLQLFFMALLYMILRQGL